MLPAETIGTGIRPLERTLAFSMTVKITCVDPAAVACMSVSPCTFTKSYHTCLIFTSAVDGVDMMKRIGWAFDAFESQNTPVADMKICTGFPVAVVFIGNNAVSSCRPFGCGFCIGICESGAGENFVAALVFVVVTVTDIKACPVSFSVRIYPADTAAPVVDPGVIVLCIHLVNEGVLLQIGDTAGTSGTVTGFAESGEQHAGEDCNDGNYDKQFDEGEFASDNIDYRKLEKDN